MLLAARLASSNRRHLGRVVIGLCFASIDRRELARCVLHRLRGCVQQSMAMGSGAALANLCLKILEPKTVGFVFGCV